MCSSQSVSRSSSASFLSLVPAGLRREDNAVPDAFPGGCRRRESRTSPEAGFHQQWQLLEGNGRAHLQHMALVDSHRPNPAVLISSQCYIDAEWTIDY